MARGFYRQIVEQLKKHGCLFKRQAAGDHELWFSPINGRTVAVDRHCMSRHTANSIMKAAGISNKF